MEAATRREIVRARDRALDRRQAVDDERLAIAHAVLLLFDDFIKFSWSSILVPGAAP